MPIEHIGLRYTFAISAILAVITKNRIMRQYDLPSIVIQFLIRLNPFKKTSIEVLIIQIVVMVSDDHVFSTFQLAKNLLRFTSLL